jgi:hypothetical protein
MRIPIAIDSQLDLDITRALALGLNVIQLITSSVERLFTSLPVYSRPERLAPMPKALEVRDAVAS